MMKSLDDNQLLTQANLTLLCDDVQPFMFSAGLAGVLRHFPNCPLTQERFNQVMTHRRVFENPAFANSIYRLPDHLFTSALFDEWIRLCERSPDNPDLAATNISLNILPLFFPMRGNQNFNNAQSTHTASVHVSVSRSAENLRNRYGKIDIENTLKKIENWLNKLKCTSANTDKIRAAKAAFARIINTGEYGYFVDPASKIKTRELCAYVWNGMHDSNCWVTEFQDEWKKSGKKEIPQAIYDRFIQILYECQRGYNIDDLELDDGDIDKPICASGTFNKVMEALHTIHQDVNIEFITKELLSKTLPIRAKQVAMTYLQKVAATVDNDLSAEEFNKLLDSIKNNGLACIWDKIREQILHEMTDFRSLFSISSNDFEDNVDVAKDTVELDEKDFDTIKDLIPKKTQSSEFCKRTG